MKGSCWQKQKQEQKQKQGSCWQEHKQEHKEKQKQKQEQPSSKVVVGRSTSRSSRQAQAGLKPLEAAPPQPARPQPAVNRERECERQSLRST